MPSVAVRDVELYYEERGRADGEPLVLLHGFSGTGRMWEQHAGRLGERYRLIVPDLRGHGRSTNPTGVIVHAELAKDVAALADALGIGRAHFCGQSSGGMLLLFVALTRSDLVHSLTLSGATYTFDERVKARVREVAANTPEQRIRDLQAAHGATHGPEYWRVLIEQWAASVQRPDELPFSPAELRAIACPTLVSHGDRDPFFPVDVPVTMYQSIPRAELCIFPDCGHGGPRERPDLFASVLLDFLGRHPLSRDGRHV